MILTLFLQQLLIIALYERSIPYVIDLRFSGGSDPVGVLAGHYRQFWHFRSSSTTATATPYPIWKWTIPFYFRTFGFSGGAKPVHEWGYQNRTYRFSLPFCSFIPRHSHAT